MRLNVLPKEFGEGRISMTRLKSNANGTAMQNESLGLFDGYTSYINIYIYISYLSATCCGSSARFDGDI